MLTVSNIEKGFAARTLFRGVSFQINRAGRYGLVGPNGAGKSTLFSIIRGDLSPDEGSVTAEKNVSIGWLAQETAPEGDETVIELATAITADMPQLRRVALRRHDVGVELGPEEIEAMERFETLGGYELDPKAKRILHGLAFRESDFDRPARELSGGWVMRAHLARLLVQEPDLLMLDEPTNHLDLESLGWFQSYLQTYPGAILIISHDREFLNALCDNIIDIRHGQLTRYRGNYDQYLEQRKAREEQQWQAYKNQQREIEKLENFIRRFRAKASKASQAQSKMKQLEKIERIEAPLPNEKVLQFEFPQPPHCGQRMIELKDTRFAYDSNLVYERLNFDAEKRERIVLVGPNGAGKSTLLKLLAGVLKPQEGECNLGYKVNVGYFAQNRVDTLNVKNNVLDEVLESARVSEETARTILGCFLFRGDDVFKKVGVLSGGEKSRLALVKFLLDPPNLLLMDEPTTHLDMASIDALIQALKQFEGTLIFISHDVHFIRAMSEKVVRIEAGKLTTYAGGYSYYLDRRAIEEGVGEVDARVALQDGARLELTDQRAGTFGNSANGKAVEAAAPKKRKTKEQKRAEAEARKQASQAKKKYKDRVGEIEREISRLDAEQRRLTAALEDPAVYEPGGNAAQLSRELEGVADLLEGLGKEWEGAAAEMEAAAKS